MATFYTPTKDKHIFAPFGPAIGYLKLSEELINLLNRQVDNLDQAIGTTQTVGMEDYSHNLVGKVKEELTFNEVMKEKFLEETKQFIAEYVAFSEVRNSLGLRTLNTEKFNYGIELVSAWVVRQFENEYNPLHIHTHCRLSCVGYLKLPEGIDKEWEEDYTDHHPSNGHIQFAHGTPSHWSMTNFMVKPQVGDFYLFPADLFHCVYPFSTVGERRSFSANLNFVETGKDT
jgi:uncharacterized protein (TIGR02466 family)